MWILLGFLALVLAEIVLLIKLGAAIGLWLTLGWIIATGFLGVVLLKGIAMLGGASMSTRLDEYSDRNSPFAHRALVLVAGLLLILPGPLTDTFGLLLLFPPFRRSVIDLIVRRAQKRSQAASVHVVVDGEWRDVSAAQTTDKPDSSNPHS